MRTRQIVHYCLYVSGFLLVMGAGASAWQPSLRQPPPTSLPNSTTPYAPPSTAIPSTAIPSSMPPPFAPPSLPKTPNRLPDVVPVSALQNDEVTGTTPIPPVAPPSNKPRRIDFQVSGPELKQNAQPGVVPPPLDTNSAYTPLPGVPTPPPGVPGTSDVPLSTPMSTPAAPLPFNSAPPALNLPGAETTIPVPNTPAPVVPEPDIPESSVPTPGVPSPGVTPNVAPSIPGTSFPGGPPLTSPAVNVPPEPDIRVPNETAPPVPSVPTTPAPPLTPGSPRAPLHSPRPDAPALKSGTPRKASITISTPVGMQTPSVSLEWVPPEKARLGQPMTCQILVKNISETTLSDVEVWHPLAATTKHLSSEPAATVHGQHLVWKLGTLAPKQSTILSVELVSHSRGTLNCQAFVRFTAGTGMQLQVREPRLVLKATGPAKSLVGEPVPLRISLSNPGDGITENIHIRTKLTAGLEHGRGNDFEVPIGELKAGETRVLQLVVKSTAGGPQQVSFSARADGDLNSSDAMAFEILSPQLNIEVAGPKLRYIDRPAEFAVKITNQGTANASQIAVREVIPPGFHFKSASNNGRFDEKTRMVTWTLAELAPGQGTVFRFDLIAAQEGDQKLITQAQADKLAAVQAETLTRIEGLSDLQLELADTDDPVEVGAQTTYEIRLANTGTKMETNLHLACTLPEGVEFLAARNGANLPYRVTGRQVIFEPLPKLVPRADVIYRISVRCLAPGNTHWQAAVRADSHTEAIRKEESTRIYNDQRVP